MPRLPKVITTSVIRSSHQGESHGGVYLVDLETEDIEQVIDWNDPGISWEGRGGDRGLRGIAFYAGRVYIAASDEVFVYDRQFRLCESYRNKYLKHCHEISVAGNTLYLTSTEIDSILEFDLLRKTFTRGYAIASRTKGLAKRIARALPVGHNLRVIPFDPNQVEGGLTAALAKNELHVNNVTCHGSAIMVAATRIEGLLALEAGRLRKYAPLPLGSHNAGIYKNGIIYNDTRADRVVIASRSNRFECAFPVPKYDDLPAGTVPNDHARQGFARGLCTFGDDFVIAGSSPSTISIYSVSARERIRSVNISKDIRNCIHGLEVWPEGIP